MEPLAAIIGVVAVCFFLLYFGFQLDDEHSILRLVCIFFAIGMLFIIPRLSLESAQTCTPVVTNVTQYNDTLITNTYTSFCIDNPPAGLTAFYRAVTWFYRVFLMYVTVYLIYLGITALRDSYQRRRTR